MVTSYKAKWDHNPEDYNPDCHKNTQFLHNPQCFISILGTSEEGSKERALHLLSLLKEARQLTKQKNVCHTNEVAFHSHKASLLYNSFTFQIILCPSGMLQLLHHNSYCLLHIQFAWILRHMKGHNLKSIF